MSTNREHPRKRKRAELEEEKEDIQSPPKPRRTQARNFILEYLGCNVSKEEILEFLTNKYSIKEYLIVQEPAQLKIHCFIKTARKIRITSPNNFDYNKDNVIYQCTYYSHQSCDPIVQYCENEKDFLTNISNFKPVVKDKKQETLILDPTKPLNLQDSTKRKIKNKPKLLSKDKQSSKFKFKVVNQVVKCWNHEKQPLWLHGYSGTGKTEYALHLFRNPLLVNNLEQLRVFDFSQHDGIVFDEMDFRQLPIQEQLYILDVEKDRAIQLRKDCVIIPAGVPKVFVSTKVIFSDDDLIKRRVNYVLVNEDLRELTNEQKEADINLYKIPDKVFENPLNIQKGNQLSEQFTENVPGQFTENFIRLFMKKLIHEEFTENGQLTKNIKKLINEEFERDFEEHPEEAYLEEEEKKTT